MKPREGRITAKKALNNLWFEGHSNALRSIASGTKRPTTIKEPLYSINMDYLKNDAEKKKDIAAWKRNSLLTEEDMIDSEEYVEDDEEEND